MTQTAYIPPLIVDRSLVVYHFEGGGFVAVVASGKVSTRDAIDMARTLIDLKAEELTISEQQQNTPALPAEIEE